VEEIGQYAPRNRLFPRSYRRAYAQNPIPHQKTPVMRIVETVTPHGRKTRISQHIRVRHPLRAGVREVSRMNWSHSRAPALPNVRMRCAEISALATPRSFRGKTIPASEKPTTTATSARGKKSATPLHSLPLRLSSRCNYATTGRAHFCPVSSEQLPVHQKPSGRRTAEFGILWTSSVVISCMSNRVLFFNRSNGPVYKGFDTSPHIDHTKIRKKHSG